MFFHSTWLIPVLAPQFYPRCIASKERKTERESDREAGRVGMYGGWALKEGKTKLVIVKKPNMAMNPRQDAL